MIPIEVAINPTPMVKLRVNPSTKVLLSTIGYKIVLIIIDSPNAEPKIVKRFPFLIVSSLSPASRCHVFPKTCGKYHTNPNAKDEIAAKIIANQLNDSKSITFRFLGNLLFPIAKVSKLSIIKHFSSSTIF